MSPVIFSLINWHSGKGQSHAARSVLNFLDFQQAIQGFSGLSITFPSSHHNYLCLIISSLDIGMSYCNFHVHFFTSADRPLSYVGIVFPKRTCDVLNKFFLFPCLYRMYWSCSCNTLETTKITAVLPPDTVTCRHFG